MLIPLAELIAKHGVRVIGVLHVGAHIAEEASAYRSAGAKRVLWIEANPELIPQIERALAAFPEQQVFNVLVSDVDDIEVPFHIATNREASSMLAFQNHSLHHPEISIERTLTLRTKRLDSFIRLNNLDLEELNFLALDIQGAEMPALQGLGSLIHKFSYVYAEVSVGPVYRGAARLSRLDAFLHSKGFLRVATRMTRSQWGDALYARRPVTLSSRCRNRASACFHETKGALHAGARRLLQRLQSLQGQRIR